jgi:hypothetical protein
MRRLVPVALTVELSTRARVVISVLLMIAGVALAGVIWAPAGIGLAVLGALLLPLPRRGGQDRPGRSRGRAR